MTNVISDAKVIKTNSTFRILDQDENFIIAKFPITYEKVLKNMEREYMWDNDILTDEEKTKIEEVVKDKNPDNWISFEDVLKQNNLSLHDLHS
jgi:KaiC/GvpD/RAD55 family RecA-like ATPase